MGSTNQKIEEDLYEDLTFQKCCDCGSVQTKNLIPLSVLYKDSHNNAVGDTWDLHHNQFSEFASKFVCGNIVEIGGSNLIVANNLSTRDHVESITVYDNNIHYEKLKSEKINIVSTFFKADTMPDNTNCVIHTHLIEHLYNPVEEIKKIGDKLKTNDYMIFSAPRIDNMLESFYTNAMNFEHTYLLCDKKLQYIVNSAGFKIVEKRNFSDYCTFYACQKVKNVLSFEIEKYEDENLINNFVSHHKKEVDKILCEIGSKKEDTFVFGAHIFTQFLLKFGLKEDLFSCVLDNDKKKIGNRLYGTNLKINSPAVLKNHDAPLVVLKAAQYTEEIKHDIIKNINPNTKFIL
tara:strand:- start:538 stop:1578 length:1041 start_codon:yes stop_codon:yes gene_type:complete